MTGFLQDIALCLQCLVTRLGVHFSGFIRLLLFGRPRSAVWGTATNFEKFSTVLTVVSQIPSVPFSSFPSGIPITICNISTVFG